MRELQKGPVKLTNERILPSEANKDGRAARVSVLFTDPNFRNDPDTVKELKDWYILFSAIGAPTNAGDNRFNPKTKEWVNKTMNDSEAKKLGLSENIWASDFAANVAKDAEKSGDGSAVLLVGYVNGRGGGLRLVVDDGSDAARVAKHETQAEQGKLQEVSPEQFKTALRDSKYELVHAVRNKETGEVLIQSEK